MPSLRSSSSSPDIPITYTLLSTGKLSTEDRYVADANAAPKTSSCSARQMNGGMSTCRVIQLRRGYVRHAPQCLVHQTSSLDYPGKKRKGKKERMREKAARAPEGAEVEATDSPRQSNKRAEEQREDAAAPSEPVKKKRRRHKKAENPDIQAAE
jgi:hypothetical protein